MVYLPPLLLNDFDFSEFLFQLLFKQCTSDASPFQNNLHQQPFTKGFNRLRLQLQEPSCVSECLFVPPEGHLFTLSHQVHLRQFLTFWDFVIICLSQYLRIVNTFKDSQIPFLKDENLVVLVSSTLRKNYLQRISKAQASISDEPLLHSQCWC